MVTGLHKRYKAVHAVKDVSLGVAAGEFIALLGPSGSGKTTLLMSIAGFERPDSGTITIGTRDVTNAPPSTRNLGMVFQRYALFPHMSVADNIAYPLKVRRITAQRRRGMVAEVLELVSLTSYRERRIDQLSGGQQQRVALARALVYRPPVLLMDEPLGALDRQLREQVQLEIRRLHRELGTTIIYVTHDQDEAMVMADRTAVMRDGQLLQIDTSERLYDRPVDPFVAGFLGRMNFARCQVVEPAAAGSAAVIDLNGHRVGAISAQPTDGGPRASRGDDISLAVRPERIRLVGPGEGLPATITEVLFTGATTGVSVDLGFDTFLVQVTTSAASRELRAGDQVDISWSPADALIYPA